MNFECEVKIVDMVMGSGKSSAAINYINQSEDEKFLYITPYMDEITDRILKECAGKKFKTPKKFGTKLNGLKQLVSKGENIASTHALFHRFDQELIDMCRAQNYTLILDEVTEVVEEYYISKQDYEILMENYAYVDEETHLLRWRPDQDDYNGKFETEKHLCEMNCLALYGDSLMMWLFPIEVFNAFRHIYILTYMFHAQMQKHYYDFFGLPYSYLYVKGESLSEYEFTDEYVPQRHKCDYKNNIHIIENEKMNQIGDSYYSLSMTWYARNANNVVMKQLRKNLVNFFRNIRGTKSNENLWTTFKEYQDILADKGYSKSFLAHTARATNKYADRTSVAYAVNKFINGSVKSFFVSKGVQVDEDGYATSEMLQFIWRSAIRDQKEIWVYIPSIRMRTLLKQWIEENSPKENENE